MRRFFHRIAGAALLAGWFAAGPLVALIVCFPGCGRVAPTAAASGDRITEMDMTALVKVTESYETVKYEKPGHSVGATSQKETTRVVVELTFPKAGDYTVRLWVDGREGKPDALLKEARYDVPKIRAETIDVGARFDRIEVIYASDPGATHTANRRVQYLGKVWRGAQ